MRVLVIDTSGAAISAAVCEVRADGVETVRHEVVIDGKAHGERLAGLVGEATGGRLDQLAAVVAGLGPGPFTGLRVGLVTAGALGDALGCPVYGVCSLDGLSAAAPGPLLVATDARRREVYWARYHDGRRMAGPDVCRPADLDVADAIAMTGAGARQYADVLGLPLLALDHPVPAELAAVAAERILDHAASETLAPQYLRRPDAVPPVAKAPR